MRARPPECPMAPVVPLTRSRRRAPAGWSHAAEDENQNTGDLCLSGVRELERGVESERGVTGDGGWLRF